MTIRLTQNDDLNFGGLTLANAWPAEAQNREFTIEVTHNGWLRPKSFEKFLRMLVTELAVDTVQVIAPSMGNRALTDVIPDMVRSMSRASAARLREVIFWGRECRCGKVCGLRRTAQRKSRSLYAVGLVQ